jgi:tRNA(Arg) A34 adenosine deaminase TadA
MDLTSFFGIDMSKMQYNVTAIIYDKRGKVLSIGKNSYHKTHPLQHFHSHKVGLPQKQFLHAEVHAIARKTLDKAHKIVVIRFDKSGNAKTAKPCPVCQSAIESAGIKFVEHT